MTFVSCEQGHFFDPAKSKVCPYCDAPKAAMDSFLEAPAIETPSVELPSLEADNSRSGFDPIVGWLVAVEGPASGRDYRLRSGANSIGSQPGAAVSIEADPTIAARDHALVLYDKRANRFFLQPGAAGGVSYVNNQITEAEVLLSAGAKIRVGGTTLVFVPLTGDSFQW